MHHKTIVFIVGLVFSTYSFAGESADSIMRKVESRDQGQDFSSSVSISIKKSSRTKERELKWWGYRNGDKDYLLMKYIAPSSLKGSGLLVKSESVHDTKQWIYLSRAAKKEPRQVASSDKGKSFMGSDYSYIDFEKFRASNFDAKLVGTEKLGGKTVSVLRLKPKKNDFPYKEIVTKVDLATYVPVESAFTGRDGTKKLYKVLDLQKVDGIWTVMESEMENLNSGSKSKISIKSIQYNKGLKFNLFNKNTLKR